MVDVELAEVNADDITKIDLTLSAPIYDNDVITVTYDAAGEIKSVDQRIMDPIDAESVVSADVNMLGIAGGFEDSLGEVWTENHKKVGATAEYSTEQVASGMYSLRLENEDGEQARVYSNAGALLSLKSGVTYTVRYKRFLTAATDLTGGDKLYIGTATNSAAKQINNVINLLDEVNTNKMCNQFTGKPAETWYAMEFEFTPDEDYNDAYFNLQINPKVGVFYYDDFYIGEKATIRP